MSGAAALYNTEVLGLATSLAIWPFDPSLPHSGAARAPLCGSTIDLAIALTPEEKIDRLGIKARSCAIGQASAAIFAGSAIGRSRDQIATALTAVQAWLDNSDAPLPDWPGFHAISAARAYPARHGAILLPWKAALAALP